MSPVDARENLSRDDPDPFKANWKLETERFVASRSFIAFVAFLIGAGGMFWAKRSSPTADQPSLFATQVGQDTFLDQFFDRGFFDRSRDPFEDMRRMREMMVRDLNDTVTRSGFDTWFARRFGGSAGEIGRREDDRFVYYDVQVQDLQNDRVEIKLEGDQISISGHAIQRENGAETVSSFRRVFPAPENVDRSRMEMTQGNDKIVVKFPKLAPKPSRNE